MLNFLGWIWGAFVTVLGWLWMAIVWFCAYLWSQIVDIVLYKDKRDIEEMKAYVELGKPFNAKLEKIFYPNKKVD